jgi:hypothetical protein
MRRSIGLVLPRSAGLGRSARTALACAFALLLVLLAVTAANAAFGVGGATAERAIRDWVSSAVYVLVAAIVASRAIAVPAKRVPWVIFALGLSLYGVGNVLWSAWVEHWKDVPIPSVCDGLWLSFYPLSYLGIVGFARAGGQRRVPAGVWLDGIVAGAGLAALGAAVVFGPVLASTTGNAVAVMTELAYPLGDLLLAALVVGLLALRGWRVDRAWGLLGGGFVLLAVADCLYALQVAGGASTPSAITNLCYVLAVALLAFAAWQGESEDHAPHLDGWSVLVVPSGFTLAALGLLQSGHWHRLNSLAFALADLTLVAARGADGACLPRHPRVGRSAPPGRDRRAHRAAQPQDVHAPRQRGDPHRPARRRRAGGGDDGPRQLQGAQRHPRPERRGRAAAANRP